MVSGNPGLVRRMAVLLGERAPVPAMLAIGVALTAAAAYVAGASPSWGGAALGGAGVAAVLVQLRLMDEVKDFAKDQAAHPDRPLPRGLITVSELRRVIRAVGVAMVAYASVVAAVVSSPAGALYAVTLGYAYLMYNEFFAPRVLARNAFAYAFTHQLLVLPLCFFATAITTRGPAVPGRAYWFALACLGASFTFELARKLDAHAHPALGTYVQRHGRAATLAAMLGALCAFTVSAVNTGVVAALWPFVALVVITLGLAQVRPTKHVWVARSAALLVLALLIAPTVLRVLAANP